MPTDDLIRLDEISEKYFNIIPLVARRRAAVGTLPIPAFRLAPNGRGPYFVTKEALDDYVGSRISDAVKLHTQMSLC
jgi:hypothetical protein